MKKYLIAFIAFSFITSVSCQEKADMEKEKAAIIAVIQDEKDGFTNMDLEQWASNVLQEPSYTFIGSGSWGYWLRRGFSEQKDVIKET